MRALQDGQRALWDSQIETIMESLSAQALAVKAAESQLRTTQVVAEKAAKGKGVSLADVSAIVARFQDSCSK